MSPNKATAVAEFVHQVSWHKPLSLIQTESERRKYLLMTGYCVASTQVSWEWIQQHHQCLLWPFLPSLHPKRVQASNSVSFMVNLLGTINMKLSSMNNAKMSSYITWLQRVERFTIDYKRTVLFLFTVSLLIAYSFQSNIDFWIIQILTAMLINCEYMGNRV